MGADPTVPEGNGFTVRRSCRFATLPYLFVIGGPSGDRTRGATIKSRVPYHSATGPNTALPLPRKHYTSHCAATRREYLNCLGRGFGGSPRSRTENLGVAVHCLSILAKEPDGTQSRSRTYVKGLEDPCTIRYTIRAYVVGPLGFEPR